MMQVRCGNSFIISFCRINGYSESRITGVHIAVGVRLAVAPVEDLVIAAPGGIIGNPNDDLVHCDLTAPGRILDLVIGEIIIGIGRSVDHDWVTAHVDHIIPAVKRSGRSIIRRANIDLGGSRCDRYQ